MGEVWITFVNIGNTEAEITHFGSDIARKHNDKFLPPGISAEINLLTAPIPLKSGERYTFKVISEAILSEEDIKFIKRGVHIPWVIAEVEYVDSIGSIRHTSVGRAYSIGREEFILAETNQYEYQD